MGKLMFWMAMAMAMAINGKPFVIEDSKTIKNVCDVILAIFGDPIPSIPPQDVKNLDGSIPGPYPDDGDEGGGHQEPAIAMRKKVMVLE